MKDGSVRLIKRVSEPGLVQYDVDGAMFGVFQLEVATTRSRHIADWRIGCLLQLRLFYATPSPLSEPRAQQLFVNRWIREGFGERPRVIAGFLPNFYMTFFLTQKGGGRKPPDMIEYVMKHAARGPVYHKTLADWYVDRVDTFLTEI